MKTKVSGEVRVRARDVVCRAVEEGLSAGLRRAKKHLEEGERLDDERMLGYLEQSVIDALDEVLSFPAEEGS